MTTINEREQRGLVIAATAKLTKKGNVWLVPSSSNGEVDPNHWTDLALS
jgi:hypothetical protein